MSNLFLSVLALGAFTMQAAPTPAPTPAPAPAPAPAAKSAEKPAMTLSGCLTKDAEAAGTYTFADSKTGAKYRLSSAGTQTTATETEQSSADTRKNDWKRGEFVLGHVTIRGGLVPSATIAGQQSALDPAKAATASLPGGTSASTGTVGLPEFRATQIRASKGACP